MDDKINVRETAPFKLKDKAGRGGIMFDLVKTFGFIPARIIIRKVHGQSNTFTVSAVLENDPDIEKAKT